MDLATTRAIKKKTQWDLRKLTGIQPSKISLIENGYVVPTEREMEAIANALDVSINEIEWSGLAEKHQTA